MRNAKNTNVGPSELLQLTSGIVCTHASDSSVPTTELSGLIGQVYRTLEQVRATHGQELDGPIPAVPIRKSVHADYLIDGDTVRLSPDGGPMLVRRRLWQNGTPVAQLLFRENLD
jgi:predicted transcriptional regulator